MKNLIAFVLALTLSTAAVASARAGEEKEKTTAATVTVAAPSTVIPDTVDAEITAAQAVESRVVKLPQDKDRPYLTVMGDPTDSRFKEVCNWFNSHNDLHTLRAQTHFNVISTSDKSYTTYAKTVPSLPCVRLQTAEGYPVAQYSGKNIPMSAEALHSGLTTQCWFRWRQRQNDNKNKPTPDKGKVQPDSDADPDPCDNGSCPDTTPANVEGEAVILAFGILAVAGIGLIVGAVIALVNKKHATPTPKG